MKLLFNCICYIGHFDLERIVFFPENASQDFCTKPTNLAHIEYKNFFLFTFSGFFPYLFTLVVFPVKNSRPFNNLYISCYAILFQWILPKLTTNHYFFLKNQWSMRPGINQFQKINTKPVKINKTSWQKKSPRSGEYIAY